MENEDIQKLKQLSQTAFSEKNKYESLWRQVAIYCGLDRYFQKETINNRKQDIEINNSQAVIALSQTSDSMLGILIGDGNFFKLKLKDSMKDILKQNNIFYSVSEIEDYIDYVNNKIKEEYFNKECNFTKALHKSIKEYFAFGNTGIGIFYNKKHKTGYSSSKLNFLNYSINNTAFMEGQDGNIDNIFMKYRWNAKKIVETFCIDDDTGEFSDEKFTNLPDKIKSSYKSQSNTLSSFNIDYVLIPNRERKPEAIEGIYSARYVGLFIDFDDKYIYEKEYYKEIPIKIIRDNVNSNEIYGKGIACNIISEIQLTNKISGDIVEQIENTVNPYLAMYENVIDDAKIRLDRNRPLILKASQNSPSVNPPIFPVIAQGNIAPVVQILIPELKNNITSGLKADIFMDFNARSNMTATESMQRYNIRNKVLFANALDFQNLLNHVITYSYKILQNNNMFQKNNDAIEYFNQNSIDWFDIEYTSELSQISKTTEIQNLTNFINTMTMVAQVYPEAIKRMDFAKIVEKIDSLFNNTSLLLDETEFKQKLEQETQAIMEQNMIQNMQAQANINNTNSQALRNQRESFRPTGS